MENASTSVQGGGGDGESSEEESSERQGKEGALPISGVMGRERRCGEGGGRPKGVRSSEPSESRQAAGAPSSSSVEGTFNQLRDLKAHRQTCHPHRWRPERRV